jgi:hypothetical protein
MASLVRFDAVNVESTASLQKFCESCKNLFKHAALGSAEEKASFVSRLLAQLSSRQDAVGEDVSLLDALRICFRDKAGTEAAVSLESLRLYTTRLEQAWVRGFWALAEMVLRCLTNATYQNHPAASTLCARDGLDGVGLLLRLLEKKGDHCCDPSSLTARHLCVRLLLLLASQQSGSVVERLQQPSSVLLVVGLLSGGGRRRVSKEGAEAGAEAEQLLFCEACKLLHLLDAPRLCCEGGEGAESATALQLLESALARALHDPDTDTDTGTDDDATSPSKAFALHVLMVFPLQRIPLLAGGRGPSLAPAVLSQLHAQLLRLSQGGDERKTLEEQAYLLTPALAVLGMLALNEEARATLELLVFPPQAQAQGQGQGQGLGLGQQQDPLKPEDAPPGTLRALLLGRMTSLESSVSRLTAELMWLLCGGDRDVFVRRTGMGNAAGLLQIKGMIG